MADRVAEPAQRFVAVIEGGVRDRRALLQVADRGCQPPGAGVTVERHPEAAPEPAPHRLRAQTGGSQVGVGPAAPWVALQVGEQRGQPCRSGAAGIERPAAQAGAVAGGQRLACGCEELHVARVRLAGRAGGAAEDAGSAHRGHEQAVVAAVPVGKRREHLVARRHRLSHGSTVIQPQSGDHRKMNTKRPRRRSGRSAPRYARLAGSVTLYRCGAPLRVRESDGCLVVPAVFKTVVDPANAGRGGFDSYPLRYDNVVIRSIVIN